MTSVTEPASAGHHAKVVRCLPRRRRYWRRTFGEFRSAMPPAISLMAKPDAKRSQAAVKPEPHDVITAAESMPATARQRRKLHAKFRLCLGRRPGRGIEVHVADLEKAVVNEDEFKSQVEGRFTRDGNTIALIAIALGLHDQDSPLKPHAKAIFPRPGNWPRPRILPRPSRPSRTSRRPSTARGRRRRTEMGQGRHAQGPDEGRSAGGQHQA